MSEEVREGRFRSLSISGFRRLKEVQLDLRPLTVLIGANGTGKTSVLDVLSLLARSASGQLGAAISDLGGLPAILTSDRARQLSLRISHQVIYFQPTEYLLRLRPAGIAYEIVEETLLRPSDPQLQHIVASGGDIQYFINAAGQTVRPSWQYNGSESALAQVPRTFQEAEDFRGRLGSLSYYHALNVEPRAPIRLPQPMQPATLPGGNGEDLVSCLFNLRETQRDRFEAIEDALHAAFPAFERLDFPPVAAGTLAMTWREKGFSRPLYMHQLSEGTLRFLWLATLLQSPGLPALTLLDEPEVSLHPALLNLLVHLLRKASARTQLVVATHSDTLIRFLKPEEVVVIDSDDDGMSTFTWADQLDLEEWLKEYSLDELWLRGRIGARP